MSLFATALSEAGALIARGVIVLADPWPAVSLLSNLLLLIACVTGLLCLGLLPLVLQWRRTPPPLAIIRFALAAGILPWVTVAGLAVIGG